MGVKGVRLSTLPANAKRSLPHTSHLNQVVAEPLSRKTPYRDDDLLRLRTVREVSRLIASERNSHRLLQRVCESLVENHGYYNAWIALFDESTEVSLVIQAGMAEECGCIVGQLRNRVPMTCVGKVLSNSILWSSGDLPSSCPECTMAFTYKDRGAFAVRLEHRGRFYGMLTASTPRDAAASGQERQLIEEIASGIGYALYAIEQEDRRNKGEAVLLERLRKMEFLCGITQLPQAPEESLESSLQKIAEYLPNAWRSPEICRARIVVNDVQYVSNDFRESPWELSAKIEAHGDTFGVVQIYHTEKTPGCGEIPYSQAERELLQAAADCIGRLVHHFQMERQFQVQHRELEDANATIRAVLGQIEQRRQDISEDIATNVESVVMPALDTLEAGIPQQQRKYLALVKQHIQEMTSPYISKLFKGLTQLTPAETQICQMIRSGLSTKEIAELRHVARSTVDRQRAKIREKLNIARTKMNLATYLQTAASEQTK